jgi:DNA-binding XRE family transcriptional regulator
MSHPSGTIYAIGPSHGQAVKIGSTGGNVKHRLRALQIGHPARLHILASVPVDTNLRAIEKAIHRFLEADRQQGEWFAVSIDEEVLTTLVQQAMALLTDAEGHGHRFMQAIQETGDRIHRCRRAAGLSQKELAERCGFPYQIINRVENGHQDLYAQRLALIAKHLGVSTDYLLGLVKEEHGHV